MTLETISLSRLALAFIPALLVIGLMWQGQLGHGKAIYGLGRMLAQLLLIGYALIYIFEAQSSLIVLLVLLVMVTASSWISLNTLEPPQRRALLPRASLALLGGGGLTLGLITQGVLQLDPWYQPRYMIPLAGMVFANAMTSLSLAAERYYAELEHGHDADKARKLAYQAAMIPVVNSLFAVGLVSLPGMMTGQILSGVSPFIAARYQIMVMCMIFGASGLSTSLFLYGINRLTPQKKPATSADT
jgi:putative ABC transport system permease protein